MGKITLAALATIVLVFCAATSCAQSSPGQQPDWQLQQQPSSHAPDSTTSCSETPAGDRVRFVCPPPVFLPDEAEADDDDSTDQSVRVVLKLPEGTALRVEIDQRTRISHVGEAVQGHVVQTVYAFDQAVIPAGTMVTGHVTKIVPVAKLRLLESYANGNFSPFRQYQVTFDRLLLADGLELGIETTVAPGAAEVVHVVSKPERNQDDEQEQAQKSGAARAVGAAKQGMKETVQEANASAHEAADEIRKPGKWHRVKQFLVEQSPYRRQYVEVGTRFSASLNQELDFGAETQTQDQLSQLGSLPLANTILHARLLLEVSSATATRGTPVVAEVTQPVYSRDYRLLLPSGSRLIGQVVEARPARRLHRNGELRVIFEHIEMPGGNLQEVQGTLEGIEVDKRAHLKLDEEGGAHATDSKTRYLSTGVALLMAALAAHPDMDRGTTVDPSDDAAVRAGAGASGFGLAGTLIGLAAKSNAVTIAFSAYGASASIYSNFLSRGREVVLPKDAPLEIGLGTRHPHAKSKAH
ncbi:MAG: TrbI/VirB10 family protein [Candidatus Acidiferrum sp.]